MIPEPSPSHPHEYPIVRFWYTRHAGQTIERIIDTDPEYFEWAVRTFQDVTPAQAEHYRIRTGCTVPMGYVRDVVPYEWQPGDGELEPYMTICRTGDLEGALRRYRGCQYTLF